MKQTEYLMFAVLLIPTVLVVAAAVVSLTATEQVPEYKPPVQVVSAGLDPVRMTTDE